MIAQPRWRNPGGGVSRLRDLSDVDSTSAVVDGQVLVYDQATGKFKGEPAASGGGGIGLNVTAAPYSADNTGATDAAPAVQAAIAAAVSTGAYVVELPAGVFLFNSAPPQVPVNLARRVVIRGAGRGATTVKLTANSIRAFDHAAAVAGDTVGNVTIEDLTVDCNNVANGHIGDHIVFGTLAAGSLTTQVNVQNVSVRRVEMVNVPNAGASQQGRRGVVLNTWHGDINLAQNTISGIRIEDVRQDGGNYVVSAMVQSPQSVPANVMHDDIEIRRVRQTNTARPVAPFFTFASAVHVCSAGWGKRCLIEDVYCEGSGDNAVEVDNMTSVVIRDVLAQDTFNPGTLISNFVAAGDSYPVTTRLNNGATLGAGATVLTVDATAGMTAGDRILIGRADTAGQELRTIQSVDSATQLTLTAALGASYADRVVVYRVGNIHLQHFSLENIRARRTSTAICGALLVQNVSNPTPIGHVEVDGLGWYSKGATQATNAQGEVIKCQTGSTNSPTGNPLSLTIRNVKVRTEGALSPTSGTTSVSPLYLIMRGGLVRTRVTLRDVEIDWSGAVQGSGTITFVGLTTSTSPIDLDVDGLTYDVQIPTSSVASKMADLNSDGIGGMSWRFRNVVVRSAVDGSGQPRGLSLRRAGAYASSTLRPAITVDAAIAATTLTLASTTGFAVGQKIVVGAESSGNAEVHTIKALTSTVITLASSAGLVAARTTGTSLVAPLNQMVAENCDFAGLGTAGTAFLASDANVLGAARLDRIVGPKPAVPATVTLPASGVEGTIVDGYDGELLLTGGTGTLVEWSNDGGANWFTVLTQAAGSINHRMRVRSGEYYRVTYTVAPTAKRLVPAR